jgi:hypothetical protein
MYYMSATQSRDEWAAEPQVRNVRSMRLRNDTWDQAEGVATELHRSRAEMIESLTEAALGFIRCYRCREPVPVRFGNLKGTPLAEAVIKTELVIARRHPVHGPVWVGDPPRTHGEPATIDEAPAAPASPGAVPVIEPKQAARS